MNFFGSACLQCGHTGVESLGFESDPSNQTTFIVTEDIPYDELAHVLDRVQKQETPGQREKVRCTNCGNIYFRGPVWPDGSF